MVRQFELPALWVKGFWFRIVEGHESQEIMGEVRGVAMSRVCLV